MAVNITAGFPFVLSAAAPSSLSCLLFWGMFVLISRASVYVICCVTRWRDKLLTCGFVVESLRTLTFPTEILLAACRADTFAAPQGRQFSDRALFTCSVAQLSHPVEWCSFDVVGCYAKKENSENGENISTYLFLAIDWGHKYCSFQAVVLHSGLSVYWNVFTLTWEVFMLQQCKYFWMKCFF